MPAATVFSLVQLLVMNAATGGIDGGTAVAGSLHALRVVTEAPAGRQEIIECALLLSLLFLTAMSVQTQDLE